RRQKRVLVRQKPLADVVRGSERKDLVDAGHEENPSQHEPGKEDRPRARPPVGRAHGFTAVVPGDQNIVFEFADVTGSRWSTSQCSTIFPAESSRKTSIPAQSLSPGHS